MPLKQLVFVEDLARQAVETAEHAYNKVKGYVPSFLSPPVDFGERLAKPCLEFTQSVASVALVNIDKKTLEERRLQVDYGVTTTRAVVGRPAADHLQAATEQYAAIARSSFHCVWNHGLFGTVLAAFRRRGDVAETAKKVSLTTAITLLSIVLGVVEFGKSQPIVQKVARISKPYVGFVEATCFEVLDFVVSTRLYASLHSTVRSIFAAAKENWLIKRQKEWAMRNVYSRVKFAADPVLDKTEPFVRAIIEHIEPKVPAQHQKAPEPKAPAEAACTVDKAAEPDVPAKALDGGEPDAPASAAGHLDHNGKKHAHHGKKHSKSRRRK